MQFVNVYYFFLDGHAVWLIFRIVGDYLKRGHFYLIHRHIYMITLLKWYYMITNNLFQIAKKLRRLRTKKKTNSLNVTCYEGNSKG